MRLVLDSNRLIAGLLKSSTSRQILLSDLFEFYAPDYLLEEVNKYREYIEKKARITSSVFDLILTILMEKITLIPFQQFRVEFDLALDIMKIVDEKDSAFLAIGMLLKLDGIWTEDKDFQKQNVLNVYSTKELLDFMDLD